ncbi:DinB family protein [Flavilitoribacter nigricans]|uniref:DinB superfamily protein n=1 Tax=Flavilitoribacter nigricans (strain ATCC 23147 / DSM 23189 / NBRC 102662 / NCIMB 1420 / SS-2) TaxID=1122177 RepID=A0A2D0MXT8_FLAN2|nr:DinB family protein [Flavilitoribacter nigricans]PHN01092.1 DinB superfamily protein [Flavilitoribacter nigricans DSM 23189 = NBRC 102662]
MQTTVVPALKALFTRDLNRLKQELTAYQTEANLWLVKGDIKNSGGNLALHLIGNLRAFIGAELGKTGYIRKRDEEFSLKDVPRDQILAEIDLTISEIEGALDQLRPEDLQAEYPLLVFREKTAVQYFLVHLATHLGYHLGQVNYHRRLLD